MEDTLPKFNLKITDDNLYDGAKQLIQKIHPDWCSTKIHYKIFTDGLTNRLIGVYRNGYEHDMILIRIYGQNTDLFIDRNIECRNMKIMYKHGLAAPIYATFLNGICYGYTPGKVLDSKMVRDDKISRLIAEQMAQMHTLKPIISNKNSFLGPNQQQQQQPKACLFRDLKKFVSLINSALLVKFPIDKKYCDVDKLQSEIHFLEKTLQNLNSPIVFCHNDLLLKNIIYDPEQNTVTFIDFEYSDYNYQAFDIANHFCELCVTESFSFKPNLYPDRKFQMKWLQNYLRMWNSLNKINNEDHENYGDQSSEMNIIEKIDTETLYHQVNRFAMASLLYWGTWALVQITNSSIDFDYITFALERLDEYFRRKNELIQQQQ